LEYSYISHSLKSIVLAKISDIIIREIDERITASLRIAILSHINPDGDAIGSMLGLHWYLLSRGMNVNMVVPNEIPSFLQWMPGCNRILIGGDEPEAATVILKEADMVFCLDFNELDRLNTLREDFKKSNAFKILIDHHPFPEDFSDITVSCTGYGSTAEMIFDIIKVINGGARIHKKTAECLFTGIMTDTGCFSFSSSDPDTFLAVAELLRTGIDKDRIYNLVYENYSDARMRLMGYSLDKKLTLIPGLNTAYIALTMQELEQYHHIVGDTEGFVNLPFSIKGIRVTALFIEKKDHIKISFRSRGDFNINHFAEKYFNGGGHKNAAGGESDLSLDDTIERFVDQIRMHAKELC
jgi:phosphoesterase RecJ-like protein